MAHMEACLPNMHKILSSNSLPKKKKKKIYEKVSPDLIILYVETVSS
jgi:hypothetical protein